MIRLRNLAVRIQLLLVFLCMTFAAEGQFYRGIKGISAYEKKLEQLDEYLSLSPSRAKKIIQDLNVQARKNDNNTLMAILRIYEGTYLYYVGQNDSALVYFEKAIHQAERIGNEQLRSTAAIRKLFILQGSNNSSPILSLMSDEYALAKQRKDTLNMIYALNGQALCYDDLDSTQACIASYIKGLKLAKNSHNDYEYGFLLNNLGLLKLRLKSPEEAVLDFRKGIAIARRLRNTRLEVTLRENLGYYFLEVDSLDKAIAEYEHTYALATSQHFSHLAFNSLVNLGSIQRRIGNNERCDSLMNVALNMARKEKLKYALAPIFRVLAQLQVDAGNYQKVEALLDSAKLYSLFSSRNENTESMFMIRYQMANKQGDYESALEYYRNLTQFRDSLDRNGHMQMLAELQLKYDYEKKEKELAEERRENDLKTGSLRQNIAISLIFLILILGSFIIYYFRQKHKRESEFSAALVNKLEEEKGRIARDLHDGVGQSLIILKNKFNKYSSGNSEASQQIDQNFSETIEEVRSISRSLIPPELKRLGLRKSIKKMLKDVEDSTSLVTTYELDALENLAMEDSDAIRIYRIIQELTNNTIKHSQATSLKIDFQRRGHRLTIVYQDNGKGMEDDSSKARHSIGMMSIVQRLKYLNGSIRIEKPARGFKAVIRINMKGL